VRSERLGCCGNFSFAEINFRAQTILAHHENPVVDLQVPLQDFSGFCAIQNLEPLRMAGQGRVLLKSAPATINPFDTQAVFAMLALEP
jgi:hypothetical protein